MNVPNKFIKTLSEEDYGKLVENHQRSKNFRVRNRSHAIFFLFNGIQLMKSLRFAGFIEMRLGRWINRWNEYGLKGSADVQKNGRPPILTVEEQAKSVEIAMRNPRISTPPIEQN